MPTVTSGGKTELEYIAEIRDELKDYPFPLRESFTGNGTAVYTRLQRFPVWDNDPFLAVVGASAYNLVPTRADLSGATDCAIDFDTGFIYFKTAPPNAQTVTITKQKVIWSDRTILRKCGDALRMMFPKVWQRQTAQVTLAVNQWEYALPMPDFQDPRTQIMRVEVQEIPAFTERFRYLLGWRRTSVNTIQIPRSQRYTPSSQVRITYAAPYRSLSDLEPQLQHLPKLYAKAMLLYDAEARRVRIDTVSATNDEQTNAPGAQAQMAGQFLAEFYRALADLERPIIKPGLKTTYDR